MFWRICRNKSSYPEAQHTESNSEANLRQKFAKVLTNIAPILLLKLMQAKDFIWVRKYTCAFRFYSLPILHPTGAADACFLGTIVLSQSLVISYRTLFVVYRKVEKSASCHEWFGVADITALRELHPATNGHICESFIHYVGSYSSL